MMRKAFALLLGLLTLCLSVPAGAVTLAELRTEVPERLTLEVEGPDGLVTVDAPIVLPEGDTLPVLRVKPVLFDSSDWPGNTARAKG